MTKLTTEWLKYAEQYTIPHEWMSLFRVIYFAGAATTMQELSEHFSLIDANPFIADIVYEIRAELDKA